MNIKLHNIEAKLRKLEEQAKTASPGMKAWLRAGYKLLLGERKRVIAKDTENSAGEQNKLL